QNRAVNLWILESANQSVFDCPPMQAREQRHLGRLAQSFLPMLHELLRLLDFFRLRVWLLFQDREVTDCLIQLEIFFRRHRFCAYFTETLYILRVFAIDDDRGMTG